MITSPSGKSYIGRSLNLEEGLNRYKNLLCSDQQYIYHAILKYGWDNMKVTILYSKERNELSNDTLNKLEEEFIEKFNTLIPNGYNLKTGGNQPKLSEETKSRMSIAKLGKKFSEEHKKRLSLAQNKEENKIKKSLTHRRSVVQLSVNGEWYSLTEASESLNISRSSIYQSCKKGYIAHGYKWKYN